MSAKQLLEKHVEELASSTGLRVEVIEEGNRLFVLLHDYGLPQGLSKVEKAELREIPAPPGSNWHGRGGFDPDGNVWVGSKYGRLAKYDPKNNVVSQYIPPTPYVNFYTARADKKGDIWAGELHGGRIARFNPRTLQWTEYVLPTAWSQEWQSWVDNSTDPVTYWYGDQYGYIVRMQPFD